MSRTKKGRRKKVATPKVVQPAVEKKSKYSSAFFKKWIPYSFPVLLAILFFIFIGQLSQNPDFKITIVQSIKWFQPFQYALFTLLTLGFGYFGWRYLENAQVMTGTDRVIFVGVSVLILAIYISAFTKEVSLNGDNAEYMIITKSLVEKGKVVRLETPSETPNSLASVGLPLLLAPIYKLWGFDIVKMKVLVMLMGFSIFFLLYQLFERKLGFALATMLATVGVTSPYIVGNARDVMTETPFLFWSVVSMLAIYKYHESKYFNWKYFLFVFLATMMTYLTRAVGAGLFAALVLFLISQVSWSKLYTSEKRKELFRSIEFRKLLYIMIPVFVGGVLWQISQHNAGVSQASLLLDSNLPQQVEYNTQSAVGVIPQMLFRAETFRFQNFYSSAKLVPLDFKFTIVLIVLFLGILNGLRQKNLMAFYILITTAIVLLASVTPQQMVIIRYLSVLIPFFIYFVFFGTNQVLRYFFRKVQIADRGSWLIKVLSLLVLSQVFLVNLQGHSVNMTLSSVGNGPGYQDFVDVARWASNNLPEDAYVVSVKPRLFYVLSGKKGTRLSTIEEEYSQEYEKEKLDLFKKLGITHVVLDGVSGATRENIFPIVQNNPDMFQTLYIGATSGTSSINKIIYKNQ
ncbi:MAG: glycosyltransferase family 39 protein [Saprospiraceae bacterium]|nr:glycosyltransferase family 39 protein [Saprospiraceae bacterium]